MIPFNEIFGYVEELGEYCGKEKSITKFSLNSDDKEILNIPLEVIEEFNVYGRKGYLLVDLKQININISNINEINKLKVELDNKVKEYTIVWMTSLFRTNNDTCSILFNLR